MKVKKNTLITVLAILFVSFVLSSCAPKIYGARRHRRDRHCGCEYVQPQSSDNYLVAK